MDQLRDFTIQELAELAKGVPNWIQVRQITKSTFGVTIGERQINVMLTKTGMVNTQVRSQAGPKAIKYQAFGESKTRLQWHKDPRCLVCYSVLKHRLELGWEFQRAISTPTKRYKRREPRKVIVG